MKCFASCPAPIWAGLFLTLAMSAAVLAQTPGTTAAPVSRDATSSPAPVQDRALRYRALKLYTTSAADAKDPALIHATMRVVNGGDRPLALRLTLAGERLGFHDEKVVSVAGGGEAAWTFDLRPPDGFGREVLRGEIAIDGRIDRDLYVAVQGADPPDFADARVEKITERARVVATYAPRTLASIQAGMKAKADAEAKRPRLPLAADGKSAYRIRVGVTAKDAAGAPIPFDAWVADKANRPAPEQELIEAVLDLQRCLKLQSGAELKIERGTDHINNQVFGGIAATPEIALDLLQDQSGSLTDGYTIKAESTQGFSTRDAHITARTLDGLRNGVYGLLTDHLDCHWFQPRQLGEEIILPADKTVSIPADLDETREPSFFSSPGMSWGNSPRWDRQNRAVINRGRMNFGHSWANYVAAAEFPYEKFPDMWARDREGKIRKKDEGWTYTNFCSTSPEVIEVVAKKVNAFFDANPTAIVTSLDPNDYAPMCLCDRCLALDKRYGVTKLDGTEVADRLLHFSKEIYDRLKPEHKDKFLGVLIYGYQMELPVSAKAHPHHAGTICDFPPRYDHTRPWNDPTSQKNQDFLRLVKGWGAQLKQMGYYDYYGHYYYFGPYGVIHKMREDLPAFREMGGTFVVIEAQPNFAMNGLNLYAAARLVWDLHADVDEVLEEFFVKYYGPAAAPMRDFWLAAERRFALTRPGTHAERAADDPEFWAELEGDLKAAEAAVGGADVAKRFKDRIAFNREGFDYGRTQWELLTRYLPRKGPPRDAAGALKFLEAAGPKIEALKAKYKPEDGYWPTLLAPYFYPDVKDIIERLKKDPTSPLPDT